MQPIQPVLFWIVAIVTGFCAIAVVVSQNIVRCAVWLLFALAGTSGVFFLLGADFVGATQLLVYVGGTLVLVVFGVMLTAQGPFITMKTGALEWAAAAFVGMLLYAVLAISILQPRVWPEAQATVRTEDPAQSQNSSTIGLALLGLPQASPEGTVTSWPDNANSKAPPRWRVGYLLPFEIVSVHLLVVLIAAAYLARAKRRRTASAVVPLAPVSGETASG
jgi:NADH-quinone oxidoreductase subunit J